MLSTFSAIIFCMMNRFIRFYGVMKWKVEYRSILLSPTYGEKVQKRKIKDKQKTNGWRTDIQKLESQKTQRENNRRLTDRRWAYIRQTYYTVYTVEDAQTVIQVD